MAEVLQTATLRHILTQRNALYLESVTPQLFEPSRPAAPMAETDRNLFTGRSLMVTITVVVAFSGALVLEGRPLICKHGFGGWAPAFTHCVSQHLFDSYTLSHVLHGVIFYWLLVPLAGKVPLAWRLVVATGMEVGWELVENSPWIIEFYRDKTASLDYAGDSIVNSLCDVLAAIGGFVVASRISWKVAILTFVVLELCALYLSRDNLTLNILMFLFPLDALKDWQMQGMPR
jgi:hypothetical protein